jgi:hypothetical protein
MLVSAMFVLACQAPVIKNMTDIWTLHDQLILKNVKSRCKEKFKHNPCLKFFLKKEERVYWAYCGGKQ